MTAPSWPRLAGWLALAQPPPCTGRWRLTEDGRDSAGTFAHRDGDWAVQGGEPYVVSSLLGPHDWAPPDFTVASGPVREVSSGGRPAWQVELLPPPHKRGRLRLTVDAGLRLPLVAENAEHGYRVEVTELVVGRPPEALFEPLRREAQDWERLGRLHELLLERPPPTPRWFPDRRAYAEDAEQVTVEGLPGDGLVARGPVDRPPPLPDHLDGDDVVRLDAHGWSWLVARRGGTDLETARAVVDAVVTGPSGSTPSSRPPGP